MIGLILLTPDNKYIIDGKIPPRPKDDKHILTGICENAHIICSENTADTLPYSIRNAAKGIYVNPQDIADLLPTTEPVVNLGISTFRTYPPSMLIVVRSKPATGKKWRKFDLSGYRHHLTSFTSINTQIDFYIPKEK
jgi:hypothetical protein